MKYYRIIQDYPGNALVTGSVFSSSINYYDTFPLLFAEISYDEYILGKLEFKHDCSTKPY